MLSNIIRKIIREKITEIINEKLRKVRKIKIIKFFKEFI